MADKPGDMFVSKGIEYILNYGPNGKLRPYTKGPVTKNPTLILLGLAVTAAALGIAWWLDRRKNGNC